jgi:hypothetical protein
MKSRSPALVGLLLVVRVGSSEAQPEPSTGLTAKSPPAKACLIVNGPNDKNVEFELATELAKGDKEKYREYSVAERTTYQGITFYLRHGHGVVRLEAWIQGKRVASTFFPSGRDPAYTDHLSLQVRNLKGGYVEAACSDVVKIHRL